jgi:hypothetical protein
MRVREKKERKRRKIRKKTNNIIIRTIAKMPTKFHQKR